jgi:hypothetical protein
MAPEAQSPAAAAAAAPATATAAAAAPSADFYIPSTTDFRDRVRVTGITVNLPVLHTFGGGFARRQQELHHHQPKSQAQAQAQAQVQAQAQAQAQAQVQVQAQWQPRPQQQGSIHGVSAASSGVGVGVGSDEHHEDRAKRGKTHAQLVSRRSPTDKRAQRKWQVDTPIEAPVNSRFR